MTDQIDCAREQIEIGSVVTLKSGGPLMTVKSDHATGLGVEYACCWIDAAGHPQTAFYCKDMLHVELSGDKKANTNPRL